MRIRDNRLLFSESTVMTVERLFQNTCAEPFPEFHNPFLMAGRAEACPRKNGGGGACRRWLKGIHDSLIDFFALIILIFHNNDLAAYIARNSPNYAAAFFKK